jgi:muconolactone delta-isomerase
VELRAAGQTVEIPLRRRDGSLAAVALVDADDAARITAFTWWLGTGGYALRTTPRDENRRKRNIRLHREVMGVTGKVEVDHINGDRLDNRKANLRIVTRAQNAQNIVRTGDSSSQHRGVYFAKGKWRAVVRVDGRSRHLGVFNTEAEAAAAATAFRLTHLPYTNEERCA